MKLLSLQLRTLYIILYVRLKLPEIWEFGFRTYRFPIDLLHTGLGDIMLSVKLLKILIY